MPQETKLLYCYCLNCSQLIAPPTNSVESLKRIACQHNEESGHIVIYGNVIEGPDNIEDYFDSME